MSSQHNQAHHSTLSKNWFDKYYKLMMLVTILFLILCLAYLGFFYSQNQDFILKDVSLSGGTTITLNTENLDINIYNLESTLKLKYPDMNFRKLDDIRTGKALAIVIESSASSDELKASIESSTGIKLDNYNSNIEFTGPTLSKNFYRQLIIALIIAFVLMSIVIFFLFKTFIPSIAVIFAAFADIIMPLAVIDYFGIRLSSAGIAAFLMLIGYSVDTDILLTTIAIKNKEGFLNQRIFRAFKTGILMTSTAIIAVLPAFFIVTGLPDSFRQIFLILAIGLFADIINTWLTNTGIIKWYCIKHNIE